METDEMTDPDADGTTGDGATAEDAAGAGRWAPLVVLAAAQFLMVLDQAVMNVSISQLVEDFDSNVAVIQGVITLYSLVMAALMLTGGKVGDRFGRRRAFGIGLAVYAAGSALTAVSWSVGALAVGWSVLEGIGAALVLPALAALIAGNYTGRSRALAYAVIGGMSGVGIAVGPILGGWVTTTLTWRLVFVGEVVVAIAILLSIRLLSDAPLPGRRPQVDGVGAGLSIVGLGLIVMGILNASTWGWVNPKNSPIEPFGFSMTLFVVAAGVIVMGGFIRWQERREEQGLDPLVHLRLLDVLPLRAGLLTLLGQSLILMGTFFVLPLYLQLVQGLDALETGIQMLPVSVTMLLTSLTGSALAARFPARSIVRTGLLFVGIGILWLLGAIDPGLDSWNVAAALAVLGVGMGLLVSQLGNVIQSAVGERDRGEAGGLQNTAQQLGASLGVALIGAIVLGGLGQNFERNVSADERIEATVQEQVSVAVANGVDFVASSDVAKAAEEAGLDSGQVDALVDSYEDSQLDALKGGLLATALLVLAALWATRRLPTTVPDPDESPPDDTGGP
ncbi:MAG: MFS transporter [Actinomycetota bacterium]